MTWILILICLFLIAVLPAPVYWGALLLGIMTVMWELACRADEAGIQGPFDPNNDVDG